MKKVIQLMISAFLILSISACSETTSENPTASSTPQAYTAGTYTAEAQGIRSPVKVCLLYTSSQW